MTVNHDVTGSSPVGGAIKAVEFVSTAFFVCEFVNFGSVSIVGVKP